MNGSLLLLFACTTATALFANKHSKPAERTYNPDPSLLKTDQSFDMVGSCPGSVITLNRFISNPGIKCPTPDNWVVDANAYTDKSNWTCLEQPTQLDSSESPETPSCESFCESFTGYKCYRAQQLGSGAGPKDPLQTCKLDNPWYYFGPAPSGLETDGCEEQWGYSICQCGTPPVSCEGVECKDGESCKNGVCKSAICHEKVCEHNGLCSGEGVCSCVDLYEGSRCEKDSLNATERAAYLAKAVADHRAKLRSWEKTRITDQFNEAKAKNPLNMARFKSPRAYQKYLNRMRHRAYIERVRRAALKHAEARVEKHLAAGGSPDDTYFKVK